MAMPTKAGREGEPELWYSVDGIPFAGDEPSFFDPAKHAWVAKVEAQWETIRDELLEFARRNDALLEPYIDEGMVSRPKKWRTIGLRFWGRESLRNSAFFPETERIVACIPGLTTVSFNLLEGNSSIKPHQGDTNAIMRCHLGLVVPAPMPRCGFRVDRDVRSWEEGKFFLFCDAHEHTAWNNTDQPRYVMVIDVFREEFRPRMREICNRVLAGIELSVLMQRFPSLRRLIGGRRVRRVVVAALASLMRLSPVVADRQSDPL